MFKLAHHGGSHVDLLTPTGKDPLAQWKAESKITKVYSKDMKQSIYTLLDTSKLQLPKDEKTPLGILQQFIVFQIFIPQSSNLNIEIALTDS